MSPNGIATAKNAIAPVSGASSGDMMRKRAKLSVMALGSKSAMTAIPNMYDSRYNCLSEKSNSFNIEAL